MSRKKIAIINKITKKSVGSLHNPGILIRLLSKRAGSEKSSWKGINGSPQKDRPCSVAYSQVFCREKKKIVRHNRRAMVLRAEG